MKLSTYTSIIEFSGHCILYNAMSGRFIVVKNTQRDECAKRIISSCIKKDAFFEQLKEGGMIVDRNIDEIEMLKKRISEIDASRQSFILHVNPTLDCNFSCWYCYEKHIRNSRIDSKTLNSIHKLTDRILQEKEELKSFRLGFFGGEPLMYFEETVEPLIVHISEKCIKKGKKFSVNFTSNGSLISDKIINCLKHCDAGLQITLDGSQDFHDKTRFFKGGKPSYNKIVQNILKLISNQIRVVARVNFTSKNIESALSILTDFSQISSDDKKYLLFDFQRVWQDRTNEEDLTSRVADDIRRRFRENGFTVLTNYLPHSVNDSCYGDKLNHLLVNFDGNVFACTARDFTEENSIGTLCDDGTILFKTEIVKQRNNSKMNKKICAHCRIAPICGGGCKQRAYEDMHSEACTFRYSQKDIDNHILSIFDYLYCKSQN